MTLDRPEADCLDVQLHDGDLAAEVELTARLMVAANESENRLSPAELDRILGIARGAAARGVPRQRAAS